MKAKIPVQIQDINGHYDIDSLKKPYIDKKSKYIHLLITPYLWNMELDCLENETISDNIQNNNIIVITKEWDYHTDVIGDIKKLEKEIIKLNLKNVYCIHGNTNLANYKSNCINLIFEGMWYDCAVLNNDSRALYNTRLNYTTRPLKNALVVNQWSFYINNKVNVYFIKDDIFTEGYNIFDKNVIKVLIGRYPFVILSDKNSMKQLEDLGLNTINKYINGSYDYFANNDRKQTAFKELQKIADKNDEEIMFIFNNLTVDYSQNKHKFMTRDKFFLAFESIIYQNLLNIWTNSVDFTS